MKKSKIMFAFFLITLVYSFSTINAESNRAKKPTEGQAVITNLGAGIHGGHYFLDGRLFVGMDFFSAALSASEDSDTGGTINMDLSLATTLLDVRYHLFESSGFYLQGGLASRNWKLEGTSKDVNGRDEFNITVEWPSIGTLVGIGGNWVADFGLSGGVSLGFLMGGAPTLDGEDNSAGGVYQAELDSELSQAEDLFSQYANTPLISAYIGWSF